MPDRPLWLNKLLTDTAMRESFLETLAHLEHAAESGLSTHVLAGRHHEAAVQAGIVEGVKSVRRLLTIAEKEEFSNVEFSEKRKGGR